MRHTTAVTGAALLLALTACSSSTGDNEPKPEQTNQPPTASTPAADKPADGSAALEAAVRAYSAAYFEPDATAAYGMLSARCKDKIPPEAYGTLLDMAAKDYGRQEIKTLTVDQQSGNLARVTYTYDVPKLNQSGQPWAREAGTWRYDAC